MSYSEFCEIMKQEKQNSKNDLVSAFKKIDVNNDGFISFSELKKALTMVGGISATYIPPPPRRAVARTLIGRGRCIFIYSGSARLTSFEINFISKETSRAEPEYMNIHPPQLTF